MKLLGIDYGTKRVGIAIGDTDHNCAVPYKTLEAGKNLIQAIRSILKEEGITRVVVGMPTTLAGARQSIAKKIERFIRSLRDEGVEVITGDERLTSKEGERARAQYGTMGKSIDVDAVAAALILQTYLDKMKL